MNFDTIDSRCTYHNVKVQMWEHLKDRVITSLAEGRRRRDAIHTSDELQSHTQELRRFFLESMGGFPEQPEGPPNVRLAGSVNAGQILIHKILLETRSNVWASANVYIPKEGYERLPAILFLCGHSVDGKADERYQCVCQLLALHGFVVLALDPTGQGERLNYFDEASGEVRVRAATGDHEYAGFQCLLHGHNLCRYMLHDARRAVDYLCHHPRVDGSRIGVTGSSGGGTQTALMMLVEPRLAAAAPATFITSRQAIFDSGYAQDAEQIWRGFTGKGYDHADLLAAFAPKPLCVLSVTWDFFPIEGARETVSEVRRFWEMQGSADCLQVFEDQSVHLYSQALGLEAVSFFQQHLQGERSEVVDATEPLPSTHLQCTVSGQIKGEIPKARTIHSENVEAFLKSRKPNRAMALEFLRGAVMRDRVPVRANLRVTRDERASGYRWRSGFWWSQKGLINSGILLDAPAGPKKRQVTLALWDEGTLALSRHKKWIERQLAAGRSVFVLNVSGLGPLAPHPFNQVEDEMGYYGTLFRICDDLVSLNDSLVALRVYDFLQTLNVLPEWEGLETSGALNVYAHGRAGACAALASALVPRLHITDWEQGIQPYRTLLESEFYDDRGIKSVVIPGLVRHADWADLLGGGSIGGSRSEGSKVSGGCLDEEQLAGSILA